MTAFGYLHHHRMELARQLLLEGHLSVGAVALAVGYATQGRFAIAFKRKFGITPRDCRLGR
jgi:AraC family transcriptional regulator, transcriptional activator of the genes for pyochelin and ferripyochelin receptors